MTLLDQETRLVHFLRPLAAFIICALLFAVPRLASAHAILLESLPKAHAVIQGPDTPIELRYNSRIDAGRSTLTLISPDGRSRPLSAIQSGPGTLTSKVSQLGRGSYVLRWQVLSGDGHISRGEIPFEVK